jgi:hypothetical protein
MSLLLGSLRTSENGEKTIELWSPIDQKTCFKVVTNAGLPFVVVPTTMQGDGVDTTVDAMEAALVEYGKKVLVNHHGNGLFLTTCARCCRQSGKALCQCECAPCRQQCLWNPVCQDEQTHKSKQHGWTR